MFSELSIIAPEIWLASMTAVVLILDLFLGRYAKWASFALCQLTLVGVLILTFLLMGKPSSSAFNNMFISDGIGTLLKFLIALFAIFVFMYSRRYVFEAKIYRSEYFILCLFSILGMMVLVSSHNFLSLYLGIEIVALPLYALIPIVKEDRVAPEAAMKYFVMGALASGMLLYGISLIYGVTSSFDLKTIAAILVLQPDNAHIALLFGLVFILAGLAFKFGAVPFHMWLPDVYQGAPISVTLFIGTLPKLSAFGFAVRILIDTFAAFHQHWQPLIMILAVASLTIGNIVALAQSNIKRMLAYSTIAHMGFVLLGLLAGPAAGFAAGFEYVIIYAMMALAAFGIITALSVAGVEAEHIQDFKGLGSKSPALAAIMLVVLFSLAGIPPFAGFYAKFFVLDALIKAGYVWLAVYAVLLTVVAAFYYLRIIRMMYFETADAATVWVRVSPTTTIALSLNGLAILALGIFPTPLYNLCVSVLP